MVNSLTLSFLQEKIAELKTALFYSQTDAVLKLPTTIINALQVDENGQIWFFVNKPSQYLQEFDSAFPARLDFFKKGKDYYVQIVGKAYIVNDPEEINHLVSLSDEVRQQALHEQVLVKIRIMKADYYESYASKNVRVWDRLFNKIYSLFFDSRHALRPYSFYTDSAAA